MIFRNTMALRFRRMALGLVVTLTMASPATPSEREYLVATGIIDWAANELVSFKFSKRFFPVGTDDLPDSGRYSVDLVDGSGQVLFTRHFENAFLVGADVHPRDIGPEFLFSEILPYHVETARIEIRSQTTV